MLLRPMRMKAFVVGGLLSLLLLRAAPLPAATLYVDGAHTSGGGDGSMANPFSTIGAAVAAAASGDTIDVAAGDYTEVVTIQNRTLVLQGGFAGNGDFGTADPRAHVTTIHGPGNDSVLVL